ncbi:MAG: phage portal protein [Acidimicrobiia bacterium]|nr:phage portal protein [Acidimicrobiia bacterium]
MTRISGATADTGFLEGGQQLGEVSLISDADGLVLRNVSYSNVYRTNPWLWAVVQLLARSGARFPMKVYRDLPGGSKERIRPSGASRASTLARAFRRPGNGVSWQTLVHGTWVDRMVHGNAMWVVERDRVGAYLGFRRIPWRHVVTEQVLGMWRYWDARTPGIKYLADDIVHFGADLDCDDRVNPSPIVSLRATLALYDAVERHLVAYFKNSARPSAHIQVDRSTGKTARDLIRAELQKLYSGPDNAGKVVVTSGEWTSMTESPENTRVVELAKQSREEICGAYGVPPPMVGILDRAIMANVRELRSHLARDVVGPHETIFEGELDAQVIARDPSLGDVFVEAEMAAMLRPDLEARASTWKDQRYVRTLNEIRSSESLSRIDHPDADVPWMPMNEAPLGADDSPDESDPDDPDDARLFERTQEEA